MFEAANNEGVSAPQAPQSTVSLNGEYRFKVDSKGRVSLPAKFRKVLSGNLVVARSLEDDYLSVFENDDYEAWINQLFLARFGGYNEVDRDHVRMRTVLKGRAKDVEVDASGRIMLPVDAREKAGIEKDVVIVGNTGRFDIYDAKRYDEMVEEVDLSAFFLSES